MCGELRMRHSQVRQRNFLLPFVRLDGMKRSRVVMSGKEVQRSFVIVERECWDN